MLRFDRSAILAMVAAAAILVPASAAAYVSDPACRVDGFKRSPASKPSIVTGQSEIPYKSVPITAGETFEIRQIGPPAYTNAAFHVWFHNRSTSKVSYRRDIAVTVNNKALPTTFRQNNPRFVWLLYPKDSIRVQFNDSQIYEAAGGFSGANNISIDVTVSPLDSRTGTTCKLAFTLVRLPG